MESGCALGWIKRGQARHGLRSLAAVRRIVFILVCAWPTRLCWADDAGRQALQRLADVYREITSADILYEVGPELATGYRELHAIIAADGRFSQILKRTPDARSPGIASNANAPLELARFQFYDGQDLRETDGPHSNFITSGVGPEFQAPSGPLQLLDAPWPIISAWATTMLNDESTSPESSEGVWTVFDAARGRRIRWNERNEVLEVAVVLSPSGHQVIRHFSDFDASGPVPLPRRGEAIFLRVGAGDKSQATESRAEYRVTAARLNPPDIESLLTFDRQAFSQVGELDSAGNVYGADGKLLYNQRQVVAALRRSSSSWVGRWWPAGAGLAILMSAWIAWRKIHPKA